MKNIMFGLPSGYGTGVTPSVYFNGKPLFSRNFFSVVITVCCLVVASFQARAQSFTHPAANPFGTMLYGSIAWADFDLDGDMDALVTGQALTGTTISITTTTVLYRNKGGNQFEVVGNTGLPGLHKGGVAWADMNNDGWPDLALSGETVTSSGVMTSSGPLTRVYKNNHDNTFTAVSTFTGLMQGSVAWGDYNNDGFKDLLVNGNTSYYGAGQTLLYKNNGGSSFSAVAVSLQGIAEGEGRWGDYDNDGRLDILLTGGDFVDNTTHPAPRTCLYHNDGGDRFSLAGKGLPALKYSSGDFGDYDQDGRLDIVLMGMDNSGHALLQVYHNEPDSTFDLVSSPAGSGSHGVVRWGDFNQDGFADLIVADSAGGVIYNYRGNDQFAPSGYAFTAGTGCDLNLTDLNQDGKLDFSLTGVNGANNYTNTSATANAAPGPPAGPQATPATGKVLLSWTAPADDHTTGSGLSYNLMISTTGNNCNVMSPEANLTTGIRYVTGPGNVGNQTWKWLDLPPGAYYWKVQAVDASFANSAYSALGGFTIPGSGMIVHINSIDQVNLCTGGSIPLKVETYPAASAYQWYKNGSAIAGATGSRYTVTTSGQYYVEAKTTGSFVRSTNTVTVSTSVEVSPPTASGGSGCAGTPITLSANCGNNATYCRWYDASGAYLGSGSTWQVSLGQTTNYLVASYNSTSQCSSAPVTVTASVRSAPPPPTGAPQQSTCGRGDTLTLTVTTASPSYLVYWYGSATGGNYVGTGNPYTIYDVTAPVTYYAAAYNPSTACYSPARLAVTGSVSTPPAPPVTKSIFPCTSQQVTLTATPTPASLSCKWYNAETGGVMFYVGNSYTFTVTDPVAYFVATYDGATGCESTERAPVAAAVRGITEAPSAQNATGYGECRVSLYAVPPPNATTCRWFADSLKRQELHTGNSFLTPILSTNSSTASAYFYYWVAGYNEDSPCVGGAMKKVKVTIKPVPTVLVNPDQAYPVPNNVFEEEYNGVNLFTGDVNLTLPLAALSGTKLSYALNAFYNSRSASITPYYTANALGGLGWKLLDYPKIAYDGVKQQYFFLDGMAAYALDILQNNGSDSITFTAPGKYATTTFTLHHVNSEVLNRTWTLVNGQQEEYQFTQAPASLPNSGYLWSLARLVDAAHTDTLAFSYNSLTQLTEIKNDYDERISLVYSNERLSSIIHYSASTNTTRQKDKVSFVYQTGHFAPNTSLYLLTGVETYANINPDNDGATWWYPQAPATLFEYYPDTTANPGALKTMTSPGGAKRTYSYLPLTLNGHTFRPVVGVATDAGHLVHYEDKDIDVMTPEEIKYTGGTFSADGLYFQSNLTTVIPGKNSQTPLYAETKTSFEDGKKDHVFSNLNQDNLKKDYPLTGTHSLKFDGTRSIHATSNRFPIDRALRRVSAFESSLSNPVKEKGSLDSLTLSFYCLQTHQSVTVDFYLDFTFYDDKKKKIDDWGCHDHEYQMQSALYGQWVPFKLRFGVPSNAAYFDFEFRGGSTTHHDFYMDDLTISGTESNVQGQLQYFFFNGGDTLRHLPDAYLQGTRAGMFKKLYYTGFESGQTWSAWLDISDGPADVEFNTDQRHTSYNGTYALRVGDYKGNRATAKGNQIPVPAGADHVLLSFHYSKPQFPGMQVRFTWGCNNSATLSQELTLDGSYFIDPEYTYFQKVVPTNGASSFSFTIEIRDAGQKSDVNDFFIDDLTVQMLHGAGNLQPVDVRSPLLTGSNYLSRTFTDRFTELQVASAVLVPAAMGNGTGYVQIKELNGTASAAAHTGIETEYDDHGWPTTATGHWARTNPDSSVTDVWSRTHFVYAKDLWSALRYNYNDQVAMQWTEISEDYFNTWSTTSGNITQWKSFYTEGRMIWNPWRDFEMTAAVSPSQITAVQNNLYNPAYTPPAGQWVQTLRTDSISPQGDVVVALVSDSVPVYTQYSRRRLEDPSQNRLPLPIATFVNGSPRTCLYYGFEDYEKWVGDPSSEYAYTGEKSARGNNLSFQLNYDPAGAGTTSYVLGAFIMPQNSAITFSVTASGGFSASQAFTFPDSLKNVWHYYEWVFTPPGRAANLQFTIRATNGANFYLDDLRFSPVTTELQTTAYEISTYRVLSEIGNNADILRMLPNREGQLHCVTGPGEVPTQFTSSYYSRNGTGNAGNYNPNDPNVGSSISVAGGGTYFGMNDAASATLWTFNNTRNSIDPTRGLTIQSGSQAALVTTKLPTNRSDWGISFRVATSLTTNTSTLPISSTPLFGLDLGNAGLAFALTSSTTLDVKIKTIVNNNNNNNNNNANWSIAQALTLPAAFSNGMALDVDLVCQNGRLFIWVNGQIVANSQTYSASQFTKLQFFYNASSNNTVSFPPLKVRNICLFTNAALAASFEDAVGNPIQEQFITEAGLVITENIYDRLNRPILQTLPVAFANTGLGFRPTFITQMNWETGYMNGDVNNGKAYIEGGGDQDKGYLYTRSIYLKSPEDKVVNEFNPGYDFALRSQTNWEKSKQWLYLHTGEIIEYGGYVLQAAGYVVSAVECVLEPEMAPLIIAADAADLITTVAQIVDEYGSSSSTKRQNSPITNYFYDRNQNLSTVHLPNANKADHPDRNQVLVYGYDFRNHLQGENPPEAGGVDYLWSNTNLLRFFAAGNDRDSNRVRYIKYDRQARMIEQGFLTGNMTTDSAALQAAVNDPSYPGPGVPHSVLNTYLWDGATTGAYGRALTRDHLTACYAWSGGHISSVVSYTYDVYGRTTSRTQDGLTLKYAYDVADNLLRVDYPPTAGRYFSVRYTYNKQGQIDSIYTSEETTALATMQYYPDGQAAQTQLNCKPGKSSIPIRYYYNAPRWLTSITAGESSTHTGTDNNSTDYFGLRLNYNLLDDTWSEIMDQVYYNGNLVSSELTPGSKATHLNHYKQGYQYDERGHLNSYYSNEICSKQPTGYCGSMTYTFDLNGNLKKEQVWSTRSGLQYGWSFERYYDESKNRVSQVNYYNANEVINYPDQDSYRRDTFYLQYDHSGNLSRQDYYHHNTYGQNSSHGSLNKIYSRQLTYDADNQVTSVKNSRTGGTDTLIGYAYSAEGYRIKRALTIGSRTPDTTIYVRGLNGELVMEIQHANGTPVINYYVHGDDGPLAMYTANGTPMDSWFVLTDRNGSATALVNRSTRDVDANFEYDAYGALLPDRCHNVRAYHLLYTGQEYDHEAHLYNFLARTYDPLLKVFLQPDPEKENLGLPYAYTGFDPVNFFDPDGATQFNVNNRKNGTNGMNEAIKVERKKRIAYGKGSLLAFLRAPRSLKSFRSRAAFAVMMESKSILSDIDSLQRRKKNGGNCFKEYKALKNILREGGFHEMAPVSSIRRVVELGISIQRFQQLTFPTTSTFFQRKVNGVWNGPAIAHGATGSASAHNELRRLLNGSKNAFKYENNLALWMSGELKRQKYRLHPSTYALLQGTRTVARRGGARLTVSYFP